MKQTNTSNHGVGKFIRGLIVTVCALFILYLIIGFFGLTAAQKTTGFMFSWIGMFFVSVYIIVRCIYPRARLSNLFRGKL